jgi:hypothetical protein
MSPNSDALSATILTQSTSAERQQDLNGLKLDSRKCRDRNVNHEATQMAWLAAWFAFASLGSDHGCVWGVYNTKATFTVLPSPWTQHMGTPRSLQSAMLSLIHVTPPTTCHPKVSFKFEPGRIRRSGTTLETLDDLHPSSEYHNRKHAISCLPP